jgi:hypothetical protein
MQISARDRRVVTVALRIGEVCFCCCVVLFMEHGLTRHGPDELRLWGARITTHAALLGDLLMAVYAVLVLGNLALYNATPHEERVGRTREAMVNRAAGGIIVLVLRVMLHVSVVGGGSVHCVVSAALVTAVLLVSSIPSSGSVSQPLHKKS